MLIDYWEQLQYQNGVNEVKVSVCEKHTESYLKKTSAFDHVHWTNIVMHQFKDDNAMFGDDTGMLNYYWFKVHIYIIIFNRCGKRHHTNCATRLMLEAKNVGDKIWMVTSRESQTCHQYQEFGTHIKTHQFFTNLPSVVLQSSSGSWISINCN